MQKYKVDWKEILYKTEEVEAENYIEACRKIHEEGEGNGAKILNCKTKFKDEDGNTFTFVPK